MKKITLILCTFVLCFTLARTQRFLEDPVVEDPVAGGYHDVDVATVDSDPALKASLDFGVGKIVKKANNAKEIPFSEYKASKINGVSVQVVAGLNYKFDVEISNGLGTTVKANFVVYYIPWENSRELTDSSYTVENEEFVARGGPGGWSEIDKDDLDNDKAIKASLSFGKKKVVDKAVADENIPKSNKYSVTKTKSAFKQVVGGFNFRFNVEISNGKGTTIQATYVVYWNPWEKTRELSKYAYEVTECGS
jgi:hypothetical protein